MKYPHTYILVPYTPDRRVRLMEMVNSVWDNTDRELTPYSFVLYENNYIGYPGAILDMVEGIDGFCFMGASDIVLGPDWLRILWEKMDEVGRDFAVEPYNEIRHGSLVQHPLLHSDLIKKYFHRQYFHYYCDNEMHERITADGKYAYCPAARMEHKHMILNKAPMDEGYRVVFNPEQNEKDRITYEKRKAAGWKDV